MRILKVVLSWLIVVTFGAISLGHRELVDVLSWLSIFAPSEVAVGRWPGFVSYDTISSNRITEGIWSLSLLVAVALAKLVSVTFRLMDSVAVNAAFWIVWLLCLLHARAWLLAPNMWNLLTAFTLTFLLWSLVLAARQAHNQEIR